MWICCDYAKEKQRCYGCATEIGSETGKRRRKASEKTSEIGKTSEIEKTSENEKKRANEKKRENGLPKLRTSGWGTTTGTSSGWATPSGTGCRTGTGTGTDWHS